MKNKNYLAKEINIHELKSSMLQILWAMNKLSFEGEERVPASKVSEFLVNSTGINISRQAVAYILDKNKDFFNHNKDGYKVMQAGWDRLSQEKSKSEVIYIKPGTPYTTKLIASSEIFNNVGQNVFICDPYFDLSTLDFIYKTFKNAKEIRVITSNYPTKPIGMLARSLEDVRKEGLNLHVRYYDKSPLHDRYIFDDKSFWLSGNSFNHLGNKESFIVSLSTDFRDSSEEIFNRRWKIAQEIV